MKLIRLKHDKKTKYHNFNVEHKLDFSFLRDAELTTVITFQNLKVSSEINESYVVNGTSRFIYKDLNDVFFYNIRSDSPLYAHVFWDVAHQVNIGGMIYIQETYDVDCILQRDYFKSSFQEVESTSKGVRAYQKVRALTIEAERGLDEWTFGIPVGPEDPLFLNKCVERILELDIPKKEIILCGRPHADFKYFDQVKIVGEDIPAPPVHITRKKNTLARSASLKNLCIIHDRVMLPKNFHQAMQRFGDDFPITGLQSFYFVDKNNLIPRRYSDFGIINEDLSKNHNINAMTQKEMRLIGRRNMYCQSPMRMNFGFDYLTGSLYICKSALWNYCPQNEFLYWDDFEDIEYAARASSVGIPSIINPYSLTQSMNSRSVMHYYGYLNALSYSGKAGQFRAVTEAIPFLRRKPLFRLTIEEAKTKLFSFAKKYSADDATLHFINQQSLSGSSRLNAITRIIESVNIPIWQAERFVKDFEKDVLCESLPPLYYDDLVDILLSSRRASEKKLYLITLPFLQNQLSHTLTGSPFVSDKNDWFVSNKKIQKYFNKFSACYLKYFMRGIYFNLSISELCTIIDGTTVYEAEGEDE